MEENEEGLAFTPLVYTIPKKPPRKPRLRGKKGVSLMRVRALIESGMTLQQAAMDEAIRATTVSFAAQDAHHAKWKVDHIPIATLGFKPRSPATLDDVWRASAASIQGTLAKRYAALTPKEIAKRVSQRKRKAASRERLAGGVRLVPERERPGQRINPEHVQTPQEREERRKPYLKARKQRKRVENRELRRAAAEAFWAGRMDDPALVKYLARFERVEDAEKPPSKIARYGRMLIRRANASSGND
jgi:hypothetical protein